MSTIYREKSRINKSFKAKTIELKLNRKEKHRVFVCSKKDIKMNKIPIIGYISMFNRKKKTDIESLNLLDLDNGKIEIKKRTMGYCTGYILTENDCAIGVKSVLPFLSFGISIIAIILYLVLAGHFPIGYTPKAPSLADGVEYNGLDTQDITDTEQHSSAIEGNMENNVNSSNKIITLGNPADNHCLMKYTVIDEETGTAIFEAEHIKPGKAVEFCAYDSFNGVKGTYKVTYNVETCSLDDENIKGSTMTVAGVTINVL